MYMRGLQIACTFGHNLHAARYNLRFNACCSVRGKLCYDQREVSKRYISLTNLSLKKEEILEIGGVFKTLTESQNCELIPVRYDNLEPDQSTIKKLRWMLQKDNLGQDMFLIGPPGPEKFRIAHMYAQMVNQEVEYVALSRDTTESDLKQRREIRNGTAYFEDQAAVRAAIHGRILILDGIEKAERNVLPVLNNLLENREMPLEDGRLLISSARYDKLLENSCRAELDNSKLVRVNEKFRVIALGLPVPKYRGHPLDPPLRSRFQALSVGPKTFKDQLLNLRQIAPGLPETSVIQLSSFAYAINAPESNAHGLPDFPIDCLALAVALMENNPTMQVDRVVHLLYPYTIFLTKDGQKMVQDLMKSFSIENTSTSRKNILTLPILHESSSRGYVPTNYHEHIIKELEESIQVHDVCLIGARGSGKSTLIKQLADRLSLDIVSIMLYQDMTARDLVQQRSTLPNGDTIWRPSALLKAAIEGKIAVLDGLHRINTGTLFTIQSLIHEREAQLFDGSRILRHDRYDSVQQHLNCSVEVMEEKKLFKVHKDFRIVALAEPPNSAGKATNHWLSPETLSMFLYHTLRSMSMAEEVSILETLIADELPSAMHPIMKLAQCLRTSNDNILRGLAPSLSTRQLLRLAKRLKEYPVSDTFELVERTCLSKFLPKLSQEALCKAMETCGIERNAPVKLGDSQLSCSTHDGMLTIGETTTKVYQQGNQAKIPDVVFYETNQHLRVLEALLQDFLLGDHLLLVGNQGVGKNRLIDRLLALMNRPREYIQLHRDTTVQSLTVQSTVLQGVVKFQDSPLVRAVQDGSVLVVDEADKAPTQVTCVLKTLVENGEMQLADGRLILPRKIKSDVKETDIIRLHPDFRMIVLANRPGFPFLGNDFFSALGDVFSVHAVENPSFESELELLQHFGPNLPPNTLRSLVQAFAQLRSMADQFLLNYPYSTREVINVVKHLERYPKDGIVRTVSNVFDFDAYSSEVKEVITRVFHEHGIPLGASTNNVTLAVEEPLTAPISGGQWTILPPYVPPFRTKKTIGFSGIFPARGINSILSPTEARLLWFSEQKTNWKLPIGETQWIHGVVTSEKNDLIHVLTTSPAVLYSLNLKTNHLMETQLDRYIDSGFYANQCRLQIASMKDQIGVFDPERCKLVIINVSDQTIMTVDLKSTPSVANTSISRFSQKWIGVKNSDDKLVMAGAVHDLNTIVFYQPNGRRLELFSPIETESTVYEMDFNIQSVFLVTNNKIIIQSQESNNKKYLFEIENGLLQNIEESEPLGPVTSNVVSHSNSKALFTIKEHYGALMTIPQNQLLLWPGYVGSNSTNTALLPKYNLVLRLISGCDVPKSIDLRDNFLQVADLTNQTLRYIPLPNSEQRRRYGKADSKTHLTTYEYDSVITVDGDGLIRLWEINQSQLAKSLEVWRSKIGDAGQLTIERTSKSGDLSVPKVGKIDPKNTPHVGGNTWAGGTGGRDTAGLGGRGGPYRLDAGHSVHQVSDEDKAAVPEEIQQAAREMGKKAYQERLKQIRMDPVNADVYQQFSSSVQKQVQALKVILSSLQAKGKERQWVKHQAFGDLDDTKIVEGLTGEKNIYRRRAELHPELGTLSVKPKHLRLLVDVSGSMYRFNSYDHRLEREMAAVLLFMEALEGHSTQWRYDVIGHSGETLNLELVSSERPPKDEKQRFDVLLNMHAHSQFCMAGDHTLEATKQSIASLSDATEIDEAFVILLSDANLDRYGIPASHLAQSLAASDNVRSAVVFIGSLGDQASRISNQLPAGSAYVCMDLHKLPQILQQIFTSVLLSN